MLICGCDSGLDGALAFLDPRTLRIVAMIGMPTMKLGKGKGSKREISARTLAVEIDRKIISRSLSVSHVYLERVQSSPQMGVASAFKFGRDYGIVEGVIAALGWPIEYVTPPKWKKALAVPAEKEDARARACQLLAPDADYWTPCRGVMNGLQACGRAEAALISLYGARQLQAAAIEPPAAVPIAPPQPAVPASDTSTLELFLGTLR